MAKLGASKGGKARAASLSPEQRSNSARRAVIARWSKEKGLPVNQIRISKTSILKATNQGVLKVRQVNIPCYVLEDGTRVISGRGLQNAFGYQSSASGVALVTQFSKLHNLDILKILQKKIEFKRPGAGGSQEMTFGYEADILVDICDILLELRKNGGLTLAQERLAHQAEVLTRAFAKVGVIALIDEATGYQKQKDAYQKILEQYIAPEIRPWVKTFDEDYYKQLYRLLGWNWDAYKTTKKNHPSYVGKLTNRIIYEKLAPGVFEALKELNPKDSKGRRKHKYHQDLSANHGYIHLIKHLSSIITIMEQFGNGEFYEALHKIDSRYPTQKIDSQLSFDFPIKIEKTAVKDKN